MPPKEAKKARAAARAKSRKVSPIASSQRSARESALTQRTRATAKSLVDQHGPLTQLNDQYAQETGSSEAEKSQSASSTTSDSELSGLCAADRHYQAQAAKRRHALLRLPSACLPMYVQLAESGLPTSACSFAAIITQRAIRAQESLLAAQRRWQQ